MANFLEKFHERFNERPKLKKAIGVIFIIIGIISILTPFTPVGFLLIIGLEIVGIRMAMWDRVKEWWGKVKK